MATIGSEVFGAKLGPIVGKMVRTTADFPPTMLHSCVRHTATCCARR